ncbi:Pet8p [Sugiyamaella lignohabitans]|uniref:Putative mitochondrial carrier protein PET8 n=1 Tax=Sugiyamaella lignohabitans TaxID=796027 RepID=A0A161HHY8_9ASCO|nr:Pet8p [Sugiyamaella lignohabitans]ANB11917.1 Pet8p [Sugiyamaella lignohabitans]
MAGTSTDLFFFPIDTLKTRLQAKGGFFANGGWHGMYRGLGSAVVASAPGASLFFLSYESSKKYLTPIMTSKIENETLAHGLVHMLAASVGEVAACSVRVPAEVVKQRVQTSQEATSLQALKSILTNKYGEGIWRGLYRGWGTTIMREIPFTMLQFPLYEYLKHQRALSLGVDKISPGEGAVCGSIAGGFAAALTTPLDVIKTRLMLRKSRASALQVAKQLLKDEGYSAFFKGIGPRTMWISAGGAIFLGVYEAAKDTTSWLLASQASNAEPL